jgi:hypothetical protein
MRQARPRNVWGWLALWCVLTCGGCDTPRDSELARKTLEAWVDGEDVERSSVFPQTVGSTAAASLYVARLRRDGPIQEALDRRGTIEVDGEKYELVPDSDKSAKYAHVRRAVKVIVTPKRDRRGVETAVVVVVGSE